MRRPVNTILAYRLKSARLMSGLSQDELCGKVGGISKQSISKYERGKMLPNSSTLIALASALGVDVDYFFRPHLISDGGFNVSFRKKSGVSVKTVESIKEEVRDKVERYMTIEDALGISRAFDAGERPASVSDAGDVKAEAARLREYWGLGSDAIVNVQLMLESHGVKVVTVSGGDGFDGLSCMVNGNVPVIVLGGGCRSAERLRLTALHELAHLLFDDRFEESLDSRSRERMCNIFANDMLIPPDVFLGVIGHERKDISLRELIGLQCAFGISVDALMVKAHDLGVINESRYRGYFTRKNINAAFKERVNETRYAEPQSERFEGLVYKAVASGVITVSKASSLLGAPVESVRMELSII